MASLIPMFAIVAVVTLAHYVIPIVIVGTIVWVALLVRELRRHRAISAERGAQTVPEPPCQCRAGVADAR